MADIGKIIGPAVGPAQVGGFSKADPSKGPSFKDALGELTKSLASAGAASPSALKFSNHAVERMRLRGINYGPEQMRQIERAVDRAAAKGARETLLLTDDSAMIVSVNNRTVVTVMDKAALKENVFTNIDSTVVI